MSLLIPLCFIFNIISTNGYIFELWSTEQFDDMIMSDAFRKSVPARTPAVIALYETECKDKLYNKIGFTAQGLPNSYAITIAAFDRKKASDIWYEFYPAVMDLFMRYNLSTEDIPKKQWCPTILFQPQDWNKPVIKYAPKLNKGSFVQWVWSNLAINEPITFTNSLDKQVNLIMRTSDSHSKDIVNEAVLDQIPPKQSVTLTAESVGAVLHGGDTIIVVDNEDNIVNRYLLDMVTFNYNIEHATNREVIDDEKYRAMMDRKVKLRDSRDWSTRRRYLNNIRTPSFIPQFTETGFKHMKMPEDICEYLTEYHAETILKGNRQRVEGFPKDGTQINTREIPTYMSHIPPDKKRWIGDVLKPMLEEWSGTTLVYSTIYGMRQYIKGAVLKTHCDRVETHIISAILHIYHSPEDEPWPIEVTSWDGKRYYIRDQGCDMTFYESSKLIHGRPSTYNGTSWINAFLHYKPVDWKGYKFTRDNKLITPTDEVSLVDWVYG